MLNAPLRFTKVVFVCLRLLMTFLHLKEKVHIHLQTKLHNYQSKQAIDIPLNTRFSIDLKRSLADSLKKWCFRRHTGMNNSLSHAHWNWSSTLWWGYSTMRSLLGCHQSQGRVHVLDSLG